MVGYRCTPNSRCPQRARLYHSAIMDLAGDSFGCERLAPSLARDWGSGSPSIGGGGQVTLSVRSGRPMRRGVNGQFWATTSQPPARFSTIRSAPTPDRPGAGGCISSPCWSRCRCSRRWWPSPRGHEPGSVSSSTASVCARCCSRRRSTTGGYTPAGLERCGVGSTTWPSMPRSSARSPRSRLPASVWGQPWRLLVGLGALAAVGAITELSGWPLAIRVSAVLYLTTGWAGALLVPSILARRGVGPVLLLLIGGLLYTVGAITLWRPVADASAGVCSRTTRSGTPSRSQRRARTSLRSGFSSRERPCGRAGTLWMRIVA